MIDVALIRERPEWVKEQLRKLNDEPAIERVDAISVLDKKRRELLIQVEAIKANRNQLSKAVGRFRGNKKLSAAEMIGGAQQAVEAIKAGNIEGVLQALENPRAAANSTEPSEAAVQAALTDLTDNMKNLGERAGELDAEIRQVEAELNEHLLWIPNLPHESTPIGMTDQENIPWDVQGEKRDFDFAPLPHWDLGPALDIIDFERGVKMSGTRFYILKGMGARLYRAMIFWLLDVHTQRGYTEIYPPFMLREDAMYGSAHFPKFRDMVYYDAESGLCMLPTAEAALTNMYRDEVLEEADLPLAVCGPHALLSPREDERRARCARYQARAPVREGRTLQVHQA